MVIRRFDRILGAERFADRARVRWQVCFRHCEVGAARAIIHGGVVILNALRNRHAELLAIMGRGDALSPPSNC